MTHLMQSPAKRRVVLTNLGVGNSIVTSIATSTSPVTFQTSGLTGAIGASDCDSANAHRGARLLYTLTVTTASHSASYKTGANNAIVVTYLDEYGATQTGNLLLTATNGGETINSTFTFASIVSIVVPGQNDTSGAWTFGTGDAWFLPFAQSVRFGSAANINMAFADGTNVVCAGAAAELAEVQLSKILFTSTTATPIYVGF